MPGETNPIHEITLPRQLWVDWSGTGHTPEQRWRQSPVNDDEYLRPQGGLWTSTLDDDGLSPYVRAMRAAMPASHVEWVERPAWALEPSVARVWEVEDRLAEVDLLLLVNGGRPVWRQVAPHVDAVRMTAAGARAFWRTPAADDLQAPRLRGLIYLEQQEFGTPLDWWEDESTLWFRWRIASVETIEPVAVPLMPDRPGTYEERLARRDAATWGR